MNWEVLGVLAEIVGAGSVILTLTYLAVQIKPNTNQLQGEAINAVYESHVTLMRDFRDDLELDIRASSACAEGFAKQRSVDIGQRVLLPPLASGRNVSLPNSSREQKLISAPATAELRFGTL